MNIYTRGSAKIEHFESKEVFEIYEDELDWKAVGGSDRGMGQENIYEAVVDHDDLGELRWSISEYPLGVENFSDTDVGAHRIVSDFDYGLENEPDNWGDQDAAFNNSITSEKMVEWFHRFHEDPQNETPYDSEKGKYFFPYGGPYDASEVLQSEFGSKVDHAEIEKAVTEIEKEGTFEWAPSNRHPDQIATAREYEEQLQEQDRFERRKGSGFNVSREAKEIILNSRSFALGLAHLFKTARGEFSFALFGRWGSGKTTISGLVSEFLLNPTEYEKELQKAYGPDVKDEQKLEYAIVNFNAWKYRQKPEIWVYLYESFLETFLKVGYVARVLRTIRVAIHKHGVIPSSFGLVLLALSTFPLMWITSIFPYAKAVFGVTGIIGLALLAYNWNASLRKLYDRYGIVTSHQEHLGMQSVIGEDLKTLISSQVTEKQFKQWEQAALILATAIVSLLWFLITCFNSSDFQSALPSLVAWLIWTLIAATFCWSTVSSSDRIDRILLVVDDLDRCPQEEILELIDGIKLMVDDGQIGNFVQPLILVDNSILREAVRNRLEKSLRPPENGEANSSENLDHLKKLNDLELRIVEHIEKVFLCHVHVPKTTESDVNDLVLMYAKEFGAEQEKDHTGGPFQRPPLPKHTSSPPSSLREQSDTVELVLSIAEVNSIQAALSSYCSRYNTTITPRMVRAFFFKYQIVRMILHIGRKDFKHQDLAEELATAVAGSNGFCTKEYAKPDSNLTDYISLAV